MTYNLNLLNFWLCHPALLYGIAFLLGLYAHLEQSIWLLVPCLSLWLPFIIAGCQPHDRSALKHLALSVMTFLTAWCYTSVHYSFPFLPEGGIRGNAQVKIKSITLQNSFFGERWLYRCELKEFTPLNHSNSIAYSLPCTISLPGRQLEATPRPLANGDYLIEGRLTQTKQGSYVLKVSSKQAWTKIPNTWSWAEQRYQWKKGAGAWIESYYPHALSGSFLAGLATGEFDDFWMRQQFARFGLQHLLAISGFHFAIIAAFLSFIFSLFCSQRVRTASLLFCLGLYCFFLGPQASILRAWFMCTLTLCGGLIEKQTVAINSLGLALLAILTIDPLLCRELGFQLSFATTAAILLFFRPAQKFLHELFPKRKLQEVMEMNGVSQHAYCILAFLRESLALSVAVNLFALPLTLFHFHQFPWMSLLYNLFFPFLATGSLCLLLLGMLLSVIPFLGTLVHRLNDVYTYFLLQMTYQIPTEVDTYLTADAIHHGSLIAYLCLAALAGIIWRERQNAAQQQEVFQFI